MWSVGCEPWAVQLPLDPVGQRELDLGVVELFDVGSSALAGGHFLNSHDLNSCCPGSVGSTHIPIALSDSSSCCEVSVFTVHVVVTTSRHVSQPDTDVLDLHRFLLRNLLNLNNLSNGPLHLLQLTHKVPEPGLGCALVGCKDFHLIQRGHPIFRCGQ